MAATLTRGPLSPRVYWTRRLLVLVTVVALTWALAHLFGGDSEPPAKARQSAAHLQRSQPSADATAPAGKLSPDVSGLIGPPVPAKARHHDKGDQGDKQGDQDASPITVAPDGPCLDSDVVAAPAIKKAYAGDDVQFKIKLHSVRAAACTWKVDARSLTVKITSGKDDIWSTLECPRAVGTHDVVLRRSEWTRVPMTWTARRSDEHCTTRTDWAMPGWYHLAVSALGGEPEDVQFELKRPQPDVITRTESPKPGSTSHKDRKRD